MSVFPTGDEPTGLAGDGYDGPTAPGVHDPLDAAPAPRPRARDLHDELLPDEDVTAYADEGAESALDALRREFAREAKPEPREWQVDARPGWSALFEVDVPERIIKGYRRRSVIKGQRNAAGEPETDEFKLGLFMLQHFCIELRYQGKTARDDAGDPLNYSSREFLDLAGSPDSALRAVAKWYASTGAVISAGRALMLASGWLDDATEVEKDGVDGPLG